MSKILIIEDDKVIGQGLVQALSHEGYEVNWATNGQEGLNRLKSFQPNLIILDIMMPQLNGFEVIAEIRRVGNTIPILVLSARTDSFDKVRGLDLGADDYLTKPFNLDELFARVRKQLKKTVAKEYLFGDFKFDQEKRLLTNTTTAEVVSLNSKELKLLELFMRREGQILTREIILDQVWGDNYDGTDRTVDNLIVSLRKKLNNLHILTERSLGYRFVTK